MGHIERQRILETIGFVRQLSDLRIPSGCLHTSVLAMGGTDIHLQDAVDEYENMTGIGNLEAFLHNQKVELAVSFKMDKPLSLGQTKKLLESPKVVAAELNSKYSLNTRIVGILFAFGKYLDEVPHVIGILPRGDMTRNIRRFLKRNDSHVVVDTSLADEPIYAMKTADITRNLNAFILNNIDVSAHIVRRA